MKDQQNWHAGLGIEGFDGDDLQFNATVIEATRLRSESPNSSMTPSATTREFECSACLS
ncbi:hypothetical protein O6R08_01105 [Cutibacterium equinum]|uniref:Uncharacterized protein n=1 Tax=Cutibacterium equinum TaxID=3016342 RepID=A0ABY7QYS3_9ACTN|nr:hypothetical protein [Cutibacterium equinum]WCC80185.1 hypothetical protein O6R08_01105 [Cutibacterium equinum]